MSLDRSLTHFIRLFTWSDGPFIVICALVTQCLSVHMSYVCLSAIPGFAKVLLHFLFLYFEGFTGLGQTFRRYQLKILLIRDMVP